ncbi:MAG: HAMP domain-containing sensor histidine kinase [Polyangia bacterium]
MDLRVAKTTRAWPVQLALLLVVGLVAAMVGADLVIERRVADRTEQMVGNTQRSVELLEDIHNELYRLSREELTEPELTEIKSNLVKLADEYKGIADAPDERSQWEALYTMIKHLIDGAPSGRSQAVQRRSEEIDDRIDALITINRRIAHHHADEIAAIHRHALVVDGSVGAAVLLLCVAVAFVLRRMIANQRALYGAHLRLLAERNSELDQFAGRAAHDLRAPLSPIRGYADLLSTGAESPEEVTTMASRIRTAVDKMSRVVDDMLELSRAGRPQPGAASPRAVTEHVLDELALELRYALVTVDVTDEEVACAPGVLEQIVRNLVQNAVKFRARDRPLEIGISGHMREDGLMELVVRDNGVGMDEELASHAFEPHHRGRTDREVPGHGLGLAIVHRTTQALGGDIHLWSRPDEGCRFTITIPSVR